MFVKRLVALLIWLLAAAEAWAGFAEGTEAYKRGDYASAFNEFLAAAEQGNRYAQYLVGAMYRKGG
jgi:uncharacterized protein